jgi:hypothetical protein
VEATLPSDSPLFPYVLALFAISFVGIIYIVMSRNAVAKRRIFPVVLTTFSAIIFLVAYGSGGTWSSKPMLVLLSLGLIANAAWARHQVRFCVSCGATGPYSGSEPFLCKNCVAAGSHR